MKTQTRTFASLAVCLAFLAASFPDSLAWGGKQAAPAPPLPGVQRVQDLPVRTWGTANMDGIALGGTLFLTLDDGIHGFELWKTDGTPSGTALVKDINPVEKHSNPSRFNIYNGQIFFVADDGQHGAELWKSDGTPQGTQMVKDIAPDGVYSGIWNNVTANGWLIFAANDQVHGWEVWRSKGDEASTEILKDIYPGTGGWGGPLDIVSTGSLAFFTMHDGALGAELWKTDGTPEGTLLVKDINPGGPWSEIFSMQPEGERVFFTANDGVHGRELWVSDGTPAGTYLVKDLFLGSENGDPTIVGALNGKVYFFAYENGVDGASLWRSDGSQAGTIRLAERLVASEFTPLPFLGADWFAFQGYEDAHGSELWISDGTPEGTRLLADINPIYSSFPESLTVLDGQLYFYADDGVHGVELWVSDGAPAGTQLFADLNPGGLGTSSFRNVYSLGESLYFFPEVDPYGSELWCTDGTLPGTALVKDINYRISPLAFGETVSLGKTLYFIYDDLQHGAELWRSDGTSPGTRLVLDIDPGQAPSWPRQLTVLGDRLYFTAENQAEGRDLWASDGSPSGTLKAIDLNNAASGYPILQLAAAGGSLWYALDKGAAGTEIWTAGGDPLAVQWVATFPADFDYVDVGNFAELDGWVYFLAYQVEDYGYSKGYHQAELWKSDGTPGGTSLLQTFSTSIDHFLVPFSTLVHAGPYLFFRYEDVLGLRQLWRTDGSVEGTLSVMDTNPANGYYWPWEPVAFRDRVVFLIMAVGGFGDLWISDGTPQGTQLMADLNGYGIPKELTVAGDLLYFGYDDGINGDELWRSDGTQDGTLMVKNLAPGAGSSIYQDSRHPTPYQDQLFFTAEDRQRGIEIWRTDGSEPGTLRVTDITPGLTGSWPLNLTVVGDALYFVATDAAGIASLWRLDLGVQSAYLPVALRGP